MLIISQICKVHKNIIFNIIGPDNENEKYKLNQISKNLNLQKYVKFHKPVYGTKKYRILQKSNFIFLTSFYECNSILALEVAACGGVLLTTKNCNLDFLIENKAAIEINTNHKIASKKILDIIQKKRITKK